MNSINLVKMKGDKNWIAAYSSETGRYIGKQKTYTSIIEIVYKMYPDAIINQGIKIINQDEFPDRLMI